MAALGALAWGYARVVGPIAQPAENAPIPNIAAPVGLPTSFQNSAAAAADDADERADWIDRAQVQVQRGDSAILLFDKAEPIDDAEGLEDGVGLVKLSPFAVLINADPDTAAPNQRPHVLQCQSARLKFEGDFKTLFRGGKVGRLLGGSLDGEVTVRGPQGLRLHGHDFTMTEDMLFSDHPVRFSFGSVDAVDAATDAAAAKSQRPTRVDGRADKVQIAFHRASSPDTSLLPRDLPRVSGFKSFQLRRNVELTMRQGADPAKPGSQPDAVTLASDGRLEYLVADRVLRMEDNVRMHHPPPETLARWPGEGVVPIDEANLDGDSLTHCDKISLVLAVDEAAAATRDADRRRIGNLDLNLVPTAVRAFGSPLIVRSRDSAAASRELQYRLADRTVSLLGPSSGSGAKRDAKRGAKREASDSARPLEVRLSQEGRVLYGESLQATLSEDHELTQAICRGSGVFVEVQPGREAEASDPAVQKLRARWTDGLTITREPGAAARAAAYRLEIAGRVQVEELGRGVKFAAGQVVARLNDTGGDRITPDGRPLLEAVEAWSGPNADGGRGDDPRGGVVTLATPDAIVQTKRLAVTIEPAPLGTIAAATPRGSRAATLFGASDRDASPVASPDRVADPVLASADRIDVWLAATESTTDLSRLRAEGRVTIAQARGDDPIAVSGESAELVSKASLQTSPQQIVTLSGSPARVDIGEIQFRAPQLIVDRAANRVSSPGGSARLPMKSSLAGDNAQKGDDRQTAASDTPSEPLLVDWAGSMQFDGRRVELLERVVAKQGETQIQCERLTVELSRRLDLSADRPDTADLDYERIVCRHSVQLTGKEWHQTEMLTLRQARAAEIIFNRRSGQMTAQGPGHLRQWSRDRQAVLPSQPRAAANRGGRADDDKWQFIDLRFEGEALGFASQRRVKLTRRVELLHSYVDSPLELVDRESVFDAAEVPSDAFWLTCQELEANLVPGAAEQLVQVQAQGQVVMEGRQFFAEADRLSYNQQTGDFHLHGQGDRRATVSVQSRSGGYDPAEARLIRINPEKRQFIADGASGFWTSN